MPEVYRPSRQARHVPSVQHKNLGREARGMSHPPLGIVRQTDPLTEEFVPAAWNARQAQLRDLLDSLAPTPARVRSLMVWAHGPPGSGKTSTVRRAMSQLEDRRVRTVFVNCFSCATFFSVIEAVLRELRALVMEMRDVAFKFERLEQAARQGPLVIVLDEVDQMFPRERNATLYNLARLKNTAVVCITQSRESFFTLDPRVQSRVQPLFLEFPAYAAEDLISILQPRAEAGLAPDSWCAADLERIAESSRGDARVAIQTLRTAAYLAEKGRVPQIRSADIQAGLEKSAELRKTYVLRGLSEHHRMIYRVVRDAKQIATSEAWKRYVALAKSQGIEPMARRTFTQYKQFLIVNRFIRERQARGRGNTRVLEVVE